VCVCVCVCVCTGATRNRVTYEILVAEGFRSQESEGGRDVRESKQAASGQGRGAGAEAVAGGVGGVGGGVGGSNEWRASAAARSFSSPMHAGS
jgi:hypothetical protein